MDTQAFRTMFPAFVEQDESRLALWGEMASDFLKESWALSGKTFQHAHFLLTAHLLILADKAENGNATGTVQSASEGSVSVSFVAPPSRNGWEFWLASTPYGTQLWALLTSLGSAGLYLGGLPERQAVRKVGGVFL